MTLKSGSETVGAIGAKNQMTLFKDDRSEDFGAILVAAVVIAIIMVTTMKKPEPAPAVPAAPAVVAAPAAPAAAPPAK